MQKLAALHRRHLGTREQDARREVGGSLREGAATTSKHGVVEPGESPSGSPVRTERQELLHGAIERLKPMEREIILLRHRERLSNDELPRSSA